MNNKDQTSKVVIGSQDWVDALIKDATKKHEEAAIAAKRKSKEPTVETNNNSEVVNCPTCKKVFTSRRDFFLHYTTHLTVVTVDEKDAESSRNRPDKKRRRDSSKGSTNVNAIPKIKSANAVARNEQPAPGCSSTPTFTSRDLTCQLCWVQCSSKHALYDHLRHHLKNMVCAVDRLNQSIISIAVTLKEEDEAQMPQSIFPD